ncbi:MAG TPA: stage IV sporulation protein A [Candidatus Choladousia intestinavium]|uniref:Stage IV sporulation protein A n=1 Tax=Candidatus Choladousia intestinavium TaxID=2840727 RepID=A0A9D1ADS5_9FIRM|nr:stage IV sporulation protein A [Candidatus Choladousia intestinavium]
MEKFDLYKDIQARTGGEIYVGVVGPVRTGKSTFLRKFMEILVLPELEDQARRVATDEMPASASGKTVTTVEPKFIPREAAQIQVGDGTVMKVRLADCVGFLVPGAEGIEENHTPRMVKTPWQEQPVPFQEAARIGTRKIITDHTTVGIVMTTDGSFGEIPRENFLEAEKEAITELQKLGKPFIVIVNSSRPYGEAARQTAEYITRTYKAGCMIQNCEQMGKSDLFAVFEQFLYEFPLTKVVFQIPKWVETLDFSHWLKQDLFRCVKESLQGVRTIRDLSEAHMNLESEYVKKTKLENVDLASGNAEFSVRIQEPLYYQILSEMTGTDINSEYQLISIVKELSRQKREYESVAQAVASVRQSGYGVIMPEKEEIVMEPPAIIRQGNRYGVKIKATSPSIHLIRAEIETEIAPIVGSESQAQDLISYMKESGGDQEGAWNTLIFGKSIEQMVDDGIRTKLAAIGDESRQKLQDTMKRIVNESRGKIICIII